MFDSTTVSIGAHPAPLSALHARADHRNHRLIDALPRLGPIADAFAPDSCTGPLPSKEVPANRWDAEIGIERPAHHDELLGPQMKKLL